MSGTEEEGFHQYDGLEGVLDPDAVDVRASHPLSNQSSPLDDALRGLDKLATALVPNDALLELIPEDDDIAKHAFALEVTDPAERLRTIVARAWRAAWEFSINYSQMDDRRADAAELRGIAEQMAALHAKAKAIAVKRRSVLDDAVIGAELRSIAWVAAGLSPLPPPVDLEHLDIEFDPVFAQLSADEQAEALGLLVIESDGRIVLNEALAAAYPDDEIIAVLREAANDWSPPLGAVSLDLIDFFILRLAESYALSFGRRIPTNYEGRRRDAPHQLAYVDEFLQNAAVLCRLPVTSWDMRVKHWRPFKGLRHRLDRLSDLGMAARDGSRPSDLLDIHRDMATIEITAKLGSATFED